MVIGSSKNALDQQLVKQLNRGAGYSTPEPYSPQLSGSEDGDEDGVDGENEEEQDEEGADADEPWDITGTWEIRCPGMVGCFDQYNPYTLEIFTEERRLGREIFGRLDLGTYKGVFRFSTIKPNDAR
jgi:hypothetical protein